MDEELWQELHTCGYCLFNMECPDPRHMRARLTYSNWDDSRIETYLAHHAVMYGGVTSTAVAVAETPTPTPVLTHACSGCGAAVPEEQFIAHNRTIVGYWCSRCCVCVAQYVGVARGRFHVVSVDDVVYQEDVTRMGMRFTRPTVICIGCVDTPIILPNRLRGEVNRLLIATGVSAA